MRLFAEPYGAILSSAQISFTPKDSASSLNQSHHVYLVPQNNPPLRRRNLSYSARSLQLRLRPHTPQQQRLRGPIRLEPV
jgi:hypothetical protein